MSHLDLEFHVEASSKTSVYTDFDNAQIAALNLALHGATVTLDVVVWSKGAAQAWGGDDAVAQYEEDPNASVFERFEIKVNALGRVP